MKVTVLTAVVVVQVVSGVHQCKEKKKKREVNKSKKNGEYRKNTVIEMANIILMGHSKLFTPGAKNPGS